MNPRTRSPYRVPAARVLDLVVTTSGSEVLVYDQTVHHIHHLNATAAAVWRLCDGERTVSEIAVETGIDQDAVKLALRTLEAAQLLDGPLATTIRGTQSRRAFIKKAAIAGALPAIVSISAPAAAQAHSTCVGAVHHTLCSYEGERCYNNSPEDCNSCKEAGKSGNFSCG